MKAETSILIGPDFTEETDGMSQSRRAAGEYCRRAAQHGLEIFRQNLVAKDWGGIQSAGNEVDVELPDDGNGPPWQGLMWFRFVAIFVAKHF
jgi:hypothetical protein